jgi:hypothetical protein
MQISSQADDNAAVALILYVYPLSAFYYFLFYTDTLSTATLVLTYWLTLRHQATSTRGIAKKKGPYTRIPVGGVLSQISLLLVRLLTIQVNLCLSRRSPRCLLCYRPRRPACWRGRPTPCG